MMENGIKPVYVFDGKPPDFKSEELQKRKEKREKAALELKEAENEENEERIQQMKKRLVKVTPQNIEDCKTLLTAMGIPWIQAPGEAEAQCAEMCKKGVVYGVGTEDMDTLTFGSPVLLRHLTYSAARKLPVVEIKLSKVLDLLELSMDEFIDLCILCGCDYTKSIKGVGPKTALSLIRKYRNIECVLENMADRFIVPKEFNFVAARNLFKNPNIMDCSEMKLQWKEPNENAVFAFLVGEKAFSRDRVVSGLKRLKLSKKKSSQRRLDSFFKVIPSKPKNRKRSRDQMKGKKDNGNNNTKKMRKLTIKK